MKVICKNALLIMFLFATCTYAKDNNLRSVSIAPYSTGKFDVASSTLMLDENKTAALSENDYEYEHAGEYIAGFNNKGKMKYITDLMLPSSTTILFNVKMPEDKIICGKISGKNISYAGLLYFPTKKSNKDEDYLLPFYGNSISKMLKSESTPKFANDNEKYPLIVFSHGLNADPLVHWQIISMLVSHGYAVLALYHGDKRFSDFSVEPYERLAARSRSVTEGINYLQTNKMFNAHIDFNKIGFAGVSYGGTTATAISGGLIVTSKKNADLSDKRIKASATHVPWMGDEQNHIWGNDDKGIENIKIPFLAISGTADTIAKYPVTLESMRKMKNEKYLVAIDGGTHSFTAGMTVIMETLTVIFFDAYIKGDKEAQVLFKKIKDVKTGQKMSFIEF